MSDDYLNLLATDAVEIRKLHGGKLQWWVGHDRETCAWCQVAAARLTLELGSEYRCECPRCGADHRKGTGQ